MNQQELGKKLRKARELVGVSQQGAAEVLGIPRTAVTQMEAGNRSVSTLELTKLAGLYHQQISYFFEEEERQEEDVLVALYRIAPGIDDDPAIKKQVNQYLEWCQQGYNLERLLGRDHRAGPPTYAESTPRTIGEAVSQGVKIAEQERKRLNLGHAPIPDMSELINEQSIWASGADFPDSISGLFLSHPSIGFAIFVNSSHVRARKRFSYAHEYAHALLDREINKITISETSNASELVEKRANAFAAAFLMPTDGVTAMLKNLDKGRPSKEEVMVFDVATAGRIDTSIRSNASDQRITYQDVAIIGHHFGVSYQAATYRLRSLNHISPKECSDLLEQVEMGKEYLEILHMLDDLEETEEKKITQRELRNHIVHLAIEAYRREEISRGKLLELGKSLEIASDRLLSLAEAVRVA